jgi:hypothetical protein
MFGGCDTVYFSNRVYNLGLFLVQVKRWILACRQPLCIWAAFTLKTLKTITTSTSIVLLINPPPPPRNPEFYTILPKTT